MHAYYNEKRRIQCGDQEFSSGDVVVVWLDGHWQLTRIEHDGDNYYSVDDYPLIGQVVRRFREDGNYAQD
jgi:hypothetical protein